MRQVNSKAKASRTGGKSSKAGKSGLDVMRPSTSERAAPERMGAQSAQGGGSQSLWRRRPMLALTLGLIGMGLIGGLYAGGHFARVFGYPGSALDAVFARAGFSVRTIALTGNERTQEDVALSTLEVEKGQSIFAAHPAEMRSRLLRLPWVADAEVRRAYPDTVSVRLIEKRPFALWKNGDATQVIERSGAVIVAAGSDAFKRLPLVAGDGAPKAAAALIDAVGRYKAVAGRLKAASRIGERRWDLLLDGGVTVKLPEEGWEAQLADLENLIVEKGVLERDIELIDLRYPDSYVFKLHNGDSHPVLRDRRA